MAATGPRYPKAEFHRRGDEIYKRDIVPLLKPSDKGKFIAIDIETGEYEIDPDEIAALDRLRHRLPDAQPWLVRSGYRTTRHFGGRGLEQS